MPPPVLFGSPAAPFTDERVHPRVSAPLSSGALGDPFAGGATSKTRRPGASPKAGRSRVTSSAIFPERIR